MGRSKMLCLRIMSCAQDQGDEDESGRPEVKSPVNKHCWSFKRRSSRRQVPDECVISEPIPVTISRKDSPQVDHESSNLPKNSDIQEGLTVGKCLEDTPPLSPSLIDADVSDTLTTAEDNRNSDSNIPESVAVVIQSAVRAYLARRDLAKRKSVVKLQAAMRGHLTRRQAIGTLRCVQAIVKMQALVRARRVRLKAKNLANSVTDVEVKQDERFDSMETDRLGAKQKKYSSTEILLRNGFARLLLESKPKTKPIYISCDHLRSDSSWKWLERWMAASSTKDLEKEGEQNDGTSCPTEGSNLDSLVTSHVLCESSTDVASCSTVSKSKFPTSEGEIKSLPDGHVSTSQDIILASRTQILVTSTRDSQWGSQDEVREPATESLGRKDYLIGDSSSSCNIESTMESGDCARIAEGIQEKNLQANDDEHGSEIFSVTNKQKREPPKETTDSIFVTEQQAFMSPLLDTSPRSCSTATESLGTSSSQVSTDDRVTKKEGRLTKRKQETKLESKKLPFNRNTELKGKNGSDPLSNDPKDGKEDNSSMTGELDETGYGSRASVSNSLPSYMQSTESSRAKIHSSNSSKPSSNDNGKDNHTRKRLSSPSDSKSEDSSSNTPKAASQARRSLKDNATQSAQKLAAIEIRQIALEGVPSFSANGDDHRKPTSKEEERKWVR